MNASETIRRLGELVTFRTGKLNSNAAVPDGKYPFFTCSQETLRTNSCAFDTECVLLAGNNANGVFPIKYFKGKFDAYQRTYVIESRDRASLSTRFLYYALQARLSFFKGVSTGAATKFLTLTILNETEIICPPIRVQQRIAGVLSAYDDLIENNQRRIQILEEMSRVLYREWFIHFRFRGSRAEVGAKAEGHPKLPHVASPLGDMPQGWEIVPLSSVVDFAKGHKPAETRQEPLPGDVKLLLIDSVRGGEAVFASPAKLVLAETRDTIMVMDGASSCEVTIGSSGAVGSTLGRFRTTRPDVFSPHALYRFLEAKAEEFKSKNIGAAIPHANKDYILTQSVALPPKAVAWSFHEQLEPIQRTIETLKAQTQNLRRTRDLLLPKLLSYEVDVSHLVAEPENISA